VSEPIPSPIPPLSPAQSAQLEGYLDRLLEANTKFNLTAIVDRKQAQDRHIVESLRHVSIINELLPERRQTEASEAGTPLATRRVLDLGSGGGLPGMVLAIARPDLRFVLLEATAKKARFLEETAQSLGLSNVKVKCERAELAAAPGTDLRESFDLVVARAVAALPTLLELAVPFLKVPGTLLAIKGEKYQEELTAAARACSILHVECTRILRHPTATVLLLTKNKRTAPLYPRRSGEPKKKPL